MKWIAGGAAAVVLSMLGFNCFFPAVFKLVAGLLPVMCLLGGCAALYIYREMQRDVCGSEPEIRCGDAESGTGPARAADKSAGSEPGVPVSAGAEAVPPAADGSLAYVGNTATLVFHRPACRFGKAKKCTAVFAAKNEALEKGYKPCGVCKP